MKLLPLINLLLLLFLISYIGYKELSGKPTLFKEISVERINVIDEKGNKYVVISNPEKQALATINGQVLDPESTERPVPGLLFFNKEGDEVGGLIFDIDSISSYQILTFDQRKGDQVMSLRKEEDLINGEWKKRYGLQIQERSEKPHHEIMARLHAIRAMSDSVERRRAMDKFWQNPEHLAPTRLFLGRTYAENIGLFLLDKNNQPRLSIYVDAEGNPIIESSDSLGRKKVLFR